MKKKNTSQLPNYQKIICRQSQNTSVTKDLLDFDFYDNNGNIWTVNQLFDKILELEQENSKLKAQLEELKKSEDNADKVLANSIETLSKQILLINTQLSERVKNLEIKTQYI